MHMVCVETDHYKLIGYSAFKAASLSYSGTQIAYMFWCKYISFVAENVS
jgi:hypothetical protein